MADLNPSKIVFLDIDHVLTNTDLDNTSFKHLDPSKYHLSEINLKFLDELLEKTKAKIVIASNWRRFKPPHLEWECCGKKFKSPLVGFKQRYSRHIFGELPPERHMTKSEALELWFEDNPWFNKAKSKYDILEDDLREGYQANLFFCKHLLSISINHTLALKQYLTNLLTHKYLNVNVSLLDYQIIQQSIY